MWVDLGMRSRSSSYVGRSALLARAFVLMSVVLDTTVFSQACGCAGIPCRNCAGGDYWYSLPVSFDYCYDWDPHVVGVLVYSAPIQLVFGSGRMGVSNVVQHLRLYLWMAARRGWPSGYHLVQIVLHQVRFVVPSSHGSATPVSL